MRTVAGITDLQQHSYQAEKENHHTMSVSSGERPPIEAIVRFWRWFGHSAERLKTLYSTNQMDNLMREVNRQIDKVEPELAWEMGPGKKKPYLLTISGEGDLRLR